MQANVTFSYTMANTVVCFSSECASQSADGLGPGTINIEEAVGWTIDSVTVSHTGGYCVYVGQGSTNNTLVCACLARLAFRVGL